MLSNHNASTRVSTRERYVKSQQNCSTIYAIWWDADRICGARPRCPSVLGLPWHSVPDRGHQETMRLMISEARAKPNMQMVN
eukprot:3273099-Pleurochrysis_carterae.AAC.1